jgi:hypothetical protein
VFKPAGNKPASSLVVEFRVIRAGLFPADQLWRSAGAARVGRRSVTFLAPPQDLWVKRRQFTVPTCVFSGIAGQMNAMKIQLAAFARRRFIHLPCDA